MLGRYVMRPRMFLKSVSVLCMALFALSACGGSTTTGTTSNQTQPPIKIGISLSLSGDFSADGKAFEQGYQLWADTVNKNGAILGRQAQLDILSDPSSTTQILTNYQKFITSTHDALLLRPSSPL